MTIEMAENARQKRERDYTKEYRKRKESIKRVYADINKNKAARLATELNRQGITYAAWLNKQIDNYLKGLKE
jgi:hypothetical protein